MCGLLQRTDLRTTTDGLSSIRLLLPDGGSLYVTRNTLAYTLSFRRNFNNLASSPPHERQGEMTVGSPVTSQGIDSNPGYESLGAYPEISQTISTKRFVEQFHRTLW